MTEGKPKAFNRRSGKYKGVFQRCNSDCPPQGRDCKKHKWAYWLEVRVGGHRKQFGKGGYDSAKDADAARKEVERQAREGSLPANAKLTVGDWLTRWYAAKVDPQSEDPLRRSTAVSYKGHIDRYLIPYLGRIRLAERRPTHITQMFTTIRKKRDKERAAATSHNEEVAKQKKGRKKLKKVPVPHPFGHATAVRVRATLSSALAAAVEQGEVVRNVAQQTRQKRRQGHSRPKPKVWQPDDLAKFLDWMEDNGERFYPLIYVCAFVGLRRGEACGLKWSAVDLKAGTITVDWQRTTAGYEVIEGKPKTDESVSTVDLDDATIAVLKAWKKAQLVERMAWGQLWTDTGLVFTREDGTGWHPDYVTKRFARLVRKFGLPHITLHSTRHTAASLQIAAGVDIAIVSKRMRHSSIGLTSDTYGHLVGTAGKKAAEAASALVPRRRRTA